MPCAECGQENRILQKLVTDFCTAFSSPSFTSTLCESVYSQVRFHTAFLASKSWNPHTYTSLLLAFSAFALSK